jgi:hypothetical protein
VRSIGRQRYCAGARAGRTGHRHGEPAIVDWSAIDRQTRLLELCGLTADERVLLLLGPDPTPDVVAICLIATERIAAAPVTMTLAAGVDASDRLVAAAAQAADVVLDLTMATDQSRWRTLRAPRTRVLVIDPAAVIAGADLQPHPGVGRRSRVAAELLRFGNNAAVSSAAGTRLTISLKGNETVAETGVPDITNAVSRWPGGRVLVRPVAGAVSGEIVIMPGDLLVDLGHLVRSPMHLRIDDDHITEISGDTDDADLLRAHLEAPASRDAYALAEVGIGMLALGGGTLGRFDPRLLRPHDGPLRAGVVEVRTGASIVAGRTGPGGVRICLRDTSVAVDGVDLVCAGTLEGSLAPDPYELAT